MATDPKEFGQPWEGEMVLACGHGWPGECSDRAEAEAFLAMCIATGDRAPCAACGEMKAIVGPLREVESHA